MKCRSIQIDRSYKSWDMARQICGTCWGQKRQVRTKYWLAPDIGRANLKGLIWIWPQSYHNNNLYFISVGPDEYLSNHYAMLTENSTLASFLQKQRYCSPTQCNVTQNGSTRTFRIPYCSACIGISQDLDWIFTCRFCVTHFH